MLVLGQEDEHAAGDGDLGGQPRALGAQGSLSTCTIRFWPSARMRSMGAGVAGVAVAPDVGHVQEGGALQAHVHEGRLHARQHAHDAAEVDVADDAAAGGALDMHFLDDALLHEGDPGSWGEVDQVFVGHGGEANGDG